MLKIAGKFGYKEIRTPVFEHTELFTRGVGDTTDVVQKEMYTFPDKGGRSITLRPEGTAGAVRAFIEHGLFNEAMPQKICYLTSCYRYEKPQAGRLREFHQFGVECLGSAEPAADAEVISLADEIFNFLGVKNLRLELNTIGCPVCRPDYHEALRKYFEKNREELCPTCLDRLSRNPMRILDCKSSICSKIAANAPVMLEHICPECSAHFESVKEYLGVMDIDFTLNPRIVRGLDYYTRTVFEFISSEIGAQGTVCGGGRYDGLVETLGGPAVPSLGFGLGIERLLLLMEKQQTPLPEDKNCEIFLVTIGKPAQLKAANLARALREEGISAQVDLVGRSVKAQMKYADKICAAYTLVLGDDELAKGEAVLRDMENGNTIIVSLSNFTEDITKAIMERAEENLRKVFEQT
jgi:histidyl-tRNA synthetase